MTINGPKFSVILDVLGSKLFYFRQIWNLIFGYFRFNGQNAENKEAWSSSTTLQFSDTDISVALTVACMLCTGQVNEVRPFRAKQGVPERFADDQGYEERDLVPGTRSTVPERKFLKIGTVERFFQAARYISGRNKKNKYPLYSTTVRCIDVPTCSLARFAFVEKKNRIPTFSLRFRHFHAPYFRFRGPIEKNYRLSTRPIKNLSKYRLTLK